MANNAEDRVNEVKKMKRNDLEIEVNELRSQVDELKKQVTYLINVLSSLDNVSIMDEGEEILSTGNWDDIIGGDSGKYSM